MSGQIADALDKPLAANQVKGFLVNLAVRREGDYIFISCRVCGRTVVQGEENVLGFSPSRLLTQAAIDHAHEHAQ